VQTARQLDEKSLRAMALKRIYDKNDFHRRAIFGEPKINWSQPAGTAVAIRRCNRKQSD
jgi:hypothetical protein